MKHVIATGIISVLILVGCSSNSDISPKEAKPTTILTTECDFEYMDPNEDIPQELETDLSENWLCKSESSPQKYPLFIRPLTPCPDDLTIGCGGAITRTAYKCSNEYFINEFTPAFGPIFYGPFYLEESIS